MARLKDIVSVAPRYARAINLERDAGSDTALAGYVITRTGQSLLTRLGKAFGDPGRHRAWTLTGPYGSGKSAFLLFLAALLGPGSSSSGRLARKLLKEQHPDLAGELGSVGAIARQGFCPVLVSGSPGSIVNAVVDAACRDLRQLYSVGRPSAAYRTLEQLAKRRNGEVSPRRLVAALMDATKSLRDSGKARGILLIVDELGKFLEHASVARGSTDLFVLQELAEATAKTKEPSILLVTVLHQAFEQYASVLRPKDRQEWEKIQGRFEDFAFQEPPDQILQLIAQALSIKLTDDGRSIKSQARRQAEEAFELGLAPQGSEREPFVRLLEACAPLHPLVVLSLARLCRKFGQNQRSLFSFLTSRELHGFDTFLEREYAGNPECYRLADFHDYVTEAFGSSLSVGDGAARWAEVAASLDRASSLPAQEIRLVKTIGVLSAVGAHGNLKPTIPILQFAESEAPSRVKRGLATLISESVVVERKHSGTVALWEGSDIDLNDRVREAARRLPVTGSMAQRANEHWRPRPLVAKRHSYRTGTLRYFDAVFADITNFQAVLNAPRAADGIILYALAADALQREELLTLAKNAEVRDRRDVVIAIPEDSSPVADAIRELELLRWVHTHTPELQSDAVARRELRSRLTFAESRVATEARRLFSPDEEAPATKWFHHGIERRIRSGRELAEFLSGVCDAIYPSTPTLRNELINRRTLSSAAAAARRNLIDGMIRRGNQRRLAFEGTPPEVSIYSSVLAQTGIHREVEGEWEFGAPRADSQLLAVWQRIEQFFDDCELERRPVTELFRLLEAPPYGLKMGVIPVLFCAAFLAHDTEVALYEEGAFLPELTVEAFERLLRAPDKFSLRRYRIEGVRREVFRQLANLFGASANEPKSNLVTVVRPLYRFFGKLPPYSQKTTAVSATAAAVRDALVSAKEPDRLLFDLLPRACGHDSFTPGEGNAKALRAFIDTLQRALLELQRTYDDLLADLRRLVLRAFAVSDDTKAVLQARAAALASHCIDGRLKAFVQQLQSADLNDATAVEAIGAVLVGKPPKAWTDLDRSRYEVALAEMARAFRHLEALVFEELQRAHSGKNATQIFRIGVADRHARDYESVVAVDARDEGRLAEAVIGLRSALDQMGMSGEPQLALAALAMICRDYLADVQEQQKDGHRDNIEVKHGR